MSGQVLVAVYINIVFGNKPLSPRDPTLLEDLLS